jgi:hypothetical protein
MTKNPILNELYEIRSQILAEHGNHLRDYLRSEFQRLKADGHPIARITQRTIRCTPAVKSVAPPMENHSSAPGDC